MTTTSSRRALPNPWLLLLVAISVSCVGKPKATDTGYAGTWTRGNERIRSTLSIVRSEGRFRTRLVVRSTDGSYAMTVGWDGRGEEVQDGAKTLDLRFRTSVEPATGRVLVECSGTPLVPSRHAFHYVDELVVAPGGLLLSAYTLERDGQRYEGDARPRREYVKVWDEVKEPPGGEGTP